MSCTNEKNIKLGNDFFDNGGWKALNKIWEEKAKKHQKMSDNEINALRLMWTAGAFTAKGINKQNFKPEAIYSVDPNVDIANKRGFLAALTGDNNYLDNEKYSDDFINKEFDRVAIETIKYCMENDLSNTPMPVPIQKTKFEKTSSDDL